MTAWLIRRFVKDYENTENGEVRAAYGTLGSCVGILVNLLLSAGKFLVGLLSGSLAIMADAANNLSDAAGSIVALVSTRMARKPVDAEHPFGHGRMEYLGSLGVGLLILVMSFTLLKDGVEAIIASAELNLSWPVLAVLAVSILVKTWLYFFYRRLGRATDNGTLLAASKDSLSDVLATGAVLLSTALCFLFGWRIDGYIGIVVALIVLKAGYEVCRDTVDRLLGGKPDPENAAAFGNCCWAMKAFWAFTIWSFTTTARAGASPPSTRRSATSAASSPFMRSSTTPNGRSAGNCTCPSASTWIPSPPRTRPPTGYASS